MTSVGGNVFPVGRGIWSFRRGFTGGVWSFMSLVISIIIMVWKDLFSG